MGENERSNEDDLLASKEQGEDNAKAIIEALMIATTEPLPLKNIAEIAGVSETVVESYIKELNQEYRETARAFEIKEIAGGFQIYTLPKYAQWVGALHKRKERLSKAALETLAIVAYHQPIIRADIEKIRGVDSTWILDSLLQKNLIKTCGRLHSPGRPIRYGTTKEFLRYFGIKDIGELPKEADFGEAVMSGYLELTHAEPAAHEGQEDQSTGDALDVEESGEAVNDFDDLDAGSGQEARPQDSDEEEEQEEEESILEDDDEEQDVFPETGDHGEGQDEDSDLEEENSVQ
jgi:segregation and condensation protein B